MKSILLLVLAMALIACLDNTAPEPDREYTLLPCAINSGQAADTANYATCTEPRPPQPPGATGG